MGQAYKIIDTDSGLGLNTNSEKEAAEYLEKIGGSGVNSTTYNLTVVDTISGNTIGWASICYGTRTLSIQLSSLVVTALRLANPKWAELLE